MIIRRLLKLLAVAGLYLLVSPSVFAFSNENLCKDSNLTNIVMGESQRTNPLSLSSIKPTIDDEGWDQRVIYPKNIDASKYEIIDNSVNASKYDFIENSDENSLYSAQDVIVRFALRSPYARSGLKDDCRPDPTKWGVTSFPQLAVRVLARIATGTLLPGSAQIAYLDKAHSSEGALIADLNWEATGYGAIFLYPKQKYNDGWILYEGSIYGDSNVKYVPTEYFHDRNVLQGNKLRFLGGPNGCLKTKRGQYVDTIYMECLEVDWIEAKVVNAPPPIMLVHGITASAEEWDTFWAPAAKFAMESSGLKVIKAPLQPLGTIDTNSDILNEFIDEERAKIGPNPPGFHVLAHSKGGLDSFDALAKRPLDDGAILSISTYSTPFKGSVLGDLAYLVSKTAPDQIRTLPNTNRYVVDFLTSSNVDYAANHGLAPALPGVEDLQTSSHARDRGSRLVSSTPGISFAGDADQNLNGVLDDFEIVPYEQASSWKSIWWGQFVWPAIYAQDYSDSIRAGLRTNWEIMRQVKSVSITSYSVYDTTCIEGNGCYQIETKKNYEVSSTNSEELVVNDMAVSVDSAIPLSRSTAQWTQQYYFSTDYLVLPGNHSTIRGGDNLKLVIFAMLASTVKEPESAFPDMPEAVGVNP